MGNDTVAPQPDNGPGIVEFDAASATSRGPRRRNEDAAITDRRSLIVADGVGGGPAGAVASRLACAAAAEVLSEKFDNPAVGLHAAFRAADQRLCRHVEARCEDDGLATTLSIATLVAPVGGRHSVVTVGWAGDSPVWRYLRETGTCERVGGDGHRSDGVITSWVSNGNSDPPRIANVEIERGDWLILGTDGLEVLDPDDLSVVVASAPDSSTATDLADRLLLRAMDRGLEDNTTVIAARLAPRPAP